MSNPWEDPFEGWGYTKYAKFIAYHKAHPWIWKGFLEVIEEHIADGETHYSADGILHIIRWESHKNKGEGEEFLFNNDQSSAYARAFQRKYPQYSTFFETRKCEAA